MNPRIPIAIVCCLIAAMVSLPTAATASYVPNADRFPAASDRYGEQLTESYLRLWQKVGPDQAGANLVIDGAPKAQVAESEARMRRWLHPPVVEPASTTTTAAPSPAPVSGSGCPASMAAESGSAGYSAYNPSSGATGCYQILGSTAAAYGCDLSTPAGQDACAARICDGQGSGAWAASGANPC